MPEFPFLTITKIPPGFLVHMGGMVSKVTTLNCLNTSILCHKICSTNLMATLLEK